MPPAKEIITPQRKKFISTDESFRTFLLRLRHTRSSIAYSMTVFKKIINKEIPAKILYEDDVCIAFHDANPQAPTHILVVPKKEIRSMAEVTTQDKEILGHLLVKCSEIAAQIGVADKGYRLVINTNSWGGQAVYHLHIHILAGRSLTWPPG